MKKILTLTFILLNSTFVFSQFENITELQKKLIEEEITGSNVAMVYQNGEIIYHHIENSLHQNSKNIYNNSIFPIKKKV